MFGAHLGLIAPVVDLDQGVRFDSPSRAAWRFGLKPTPAGDLDGDGLDDVIADCYDCEGGAVYLYWGAGLAACGVLSTGDADVAIEGDATEDPAFALDVQGGVDLDGDGRGDWVASAWESGETGGVFLWFDSPSLEGGVHTPYDADVQLVEEDEEGALGVSLAGGDFDGDGKDDLAIQNNWTEFALYLFYNEDLPLSGTESVGTASRIYTPEDASRWNFGNLKMDGDLDGDGANELVYADPFWAPDGYGGWYGSALIFHGE